MSRLVAIGVLLTAALAAQADDQRKATVGMRARIDELVLPGSEIVPAPVEHDAVVIVRVLATRPHGTVFRYDLEWSALEPGHYDLRSYLAHKDGSPTTDLPAIEVDVESVLPKEDREPSEPDPVAPARVGGYSTVQVVVAIAWVVGLVLILFVGRKRRRAAAAAAPRATLADRLRPIVEAAASGAATDAQKAELERLLVQFWRARLGLGDVRADRAIMAVRANAEAGQLLRELDAWLHMPQPPHAVDVQALLAPYRNVPADAFDVRPAGQEPR